MSVFSKSTLALQGQRQEAPAEPPALPPAQAAEEEGVEMVSLAKLLHDDEGFRLTVYDDATGESLAPGMKLVGHPTIGIGRCLDRKGISADEAHMLLENDVAEVRSQVERRIPWSADLSPNRRLVLQAMAFQMGIDGLLGFKNTLAMMQKGDYDGAARGMLNSLWARQTPGRAARMAEMIRRG